MKGTNFIFEFFYTSFIFFQRVNIFSGKPMYGVFIDFIGTANHTGNVICTFCNKPLDRANFGHIKLIFFLERFTFFLRSDIVSV